MRFPRVVSKLADARAQELRLRRRDLAQTLGVAHVLETHARLYLGDAPTTLELIEGLTLAELWPTLNRVLAVSRGEAAPGEAKGP